MSVHTDETMKRRWVEVELEVDASPEEVWEAIATGPGIGAWFVPAEVEEHQGGALAFHFGGTMGSSTGVVTAWEPPRRFCYEEPHWLPGAPPVATEVTVEARGGGTCLLRMVHSLATASDTWDDHLEGFERGWVPFFEILRRYLAEHAGAGCSSVRLTLEVPGTADDAWAGLTHSLGLAGADEGERVTAASDAPTFSGRVLRSLDQKDQRELLVTLGEPAPGFALLGAFAWGEATYVSIALYLYGEAGRAAAPAAEADWTRWSERHLSEAGGGSGDGTDGTG